LRHRKGSFQEGLLTHRRLVQGEAQLLVWDESTVQVKGTWCDTAKTGNASPTENPVFYAWV
jgi:hypothetical protein